MAETQVHWLLGKNSTGISFVEGTGWKEAGRSTFLYTCKGHEDAFVPGAVLHGPSIGTGFTKDRTWFGSCTIYTGAPLCFLYYNSYDERVSSYPIEERPWNNEYYEVHAAKYLLCLSQLYYLQNKFVSKNR